MVYLLSLLTSLAMIIPIMIVGMDTSQRMGEYGYNTIVFQRDKIVITRVTDEGNKADGFHSPIVIDADRICDLKIYKGKRWLFAPYTFGFKFIDKEHWKKYPHKNIFNFVYCSVLTRKQWEELKSSLVPLIEEFKKRNEIKYCRAVKPEKNENIAKKGVHIVPNDTKKYELYAYFEFLIILTSLTLLLAYISSIKIGFSWIDMIIAVILGFTITFIPYALIFIHNKRAGEYGNNVIEIGDDCITVTYFNGNVKKLCAKDVCGYMELKRYARNMTGLSKIGIKYLDRELVERWNSTIGMKILLPLGVATKAQWEMLRKEIEKFKNRNGIPDCMKNKQKINY